MDIQVPISDSVLSNIKEVKAKKSTTQQIPRVLREQRWKHDPTNRICKA